MIGKITPAGTITTYPLPSPTSGPTGLTVGPDGNLWFTDPEDAPKIGKITPSGAVTEYPIPDPNANPEDIVAGPDGNLWFTESGAGKIAKITPDGSVTEYPIPLNLCPRLPRRIVTGPDGNLWFTNGPGLDCGGIGKVKPTVEISLAVDIHPIQPTDIAADSNGALWFTAYDDTTSTGLVGKILSDGSVTRYPTPNAGEPFPITRGPDDNMWFFENNGRGTNHTIAKITPNGSITEYPALLPTEGVEGMTTGPDGNLWLRLGSKIARITITPASPTPSATVSPPTTPAPHPTVGPQGPAPLGGCYDAKYGDLESIPAAQYCASALARAGYAVDPACVDLASPCHNDTAQQAAGRADIQRVFFSAGHARTCSLTPGDPGYLGIGILFESPAGGNDSLLDGPDTSCDGQGVPSFNVTTSPGGLTNADFVILEECLTLHNTSKHTSIGQEIYDSGAGTVLGFTDELGFPWPGVTWAEGFWNAFGHGFDINTAANYGVEWVLIQGGGIPYGYDSFKVESHSGAPTRLSPFP